MSELSDSKQRLLIVDDSKVIRVTARKILQNHFETVEAVDGNNAWEILTSQVPFSLIVSDLTMPNLDGFGLLEKIRSSHLPHVRDIPVIIITGANDSEATMQRATAAGATDFIGKPFDSVHLLARTQAHAGSYTINHALTEENMVLEDQAMVDPLTGLANDTAFIEQGRQQLAYAIRHHTGLALASLEIDNFDKLVRQHDTDAGERVIKSVGSALAANIRKEDVAARTGTARYAVLLPGMDATGVSRLSERITGDICKQAVISAGQQVRFTVSIGIAAPEIRPDTQLDDLLAAAGDRLKQALARGGDQVIVDEPDSGEPAPDTAGQSFEWSLEAFENATFEAAEPEGTVPEIDYMELEAPEPLPDLVAEPQATGTVTADSELITDFTDAAGPEHCAASMSPDAVADEVDETIVITSPYNLFDLDELQITDTAAEADTTRTMDREADAAPYSAASGTVTSIENTPPEEGGSTDTDAKRPGVFRRLLGALFGRRE